MIKPKEYDKVEIQMEKDFESMCVTLSEHVNKDPKRLTVKEFYTAIEVVNKKKPKHF